MLVPKCPECLSPDIDPDANSTCGWWRCANCGALFDYESALIELREAVDFRSAIETEPLFHLNSRLATIELRVAGGPLQPVSPYSDPGEMHRALDAALARGVIESRRDGAALHAYAIPGADFHTVLGVDPGVGAELIGPRLVMKQEPGEDPISYTVRWLDWIVESANALVGGQLQAAKGRRPEIDLGTAEDEEQRR